MRKITVVYIIRRDTQVHGVEHLLVVVDTDVDGLVVSDGVVDDRVHYKRIVANVFLLARADVGVAEVGVHLLVVVAQQQLL